VSDFGLIIIWKPFQQRSFPSLLIVLGSPEVDGPWT
jgi:hypothetical protein